MRSATAAKVFKAKGDGGSGKADEADRGDEYVEDAVPTR
jgi:hypothetical protein